MNKSGNQSIVIRRLIATKVQSQARHEPRTCGIFERSWAAALDLVFEQTSTEWQYRASLTNLPSSQLVDKHKRINWPPPGADRLSL